MIYALHKRQQNIRTAARICESFLYPQTNWSFDISTHL